MQVGSYALTLDSWEHIRRHFLSYFEVLRIITGHKSRKSGTWFSLGASGPY